MLLPDLSSIPIKAKIDTGARTSTLHASAMVVQTRDGHPWVQFEISPIQRSREYRRTVVCPIAGYKRVRSSTGHSETRPVIRTLIQIGEHEMYIDVTLTSRDTMGFRLLLGRAAIRRRFWVDPGRSFLHPAPPLTVGSEEAVEKA